MAEFKIYDLHTHTINSQDGNHPVELMAETAIENGIECVAFTDHCEVDVFYKDGFDKRAAQSYIDISRAKLQYADKIKILRGIELAQPHYEPELAEKIITMNEYDEIIGSIHNLRGMPDFYDFKSFDGFAIEELMNEYFDELIAMLEWGKFDVLAHITYPFRYIFNLCGYIEDVNKYSKKIDELLKLCAEKDKALEINMGGLKYPINKPSPDIETVKRYKELGGRLISVGSDSHYAERIGFGIPRAYEIALEAGFKSIAVFENRKPSEIAIK